MNAAKCRSMLVALVAVVWFPASQAANFERANVTTQDVIAEVGQHTGIAADTLQAVNKSSPALLENLKDTVTAIKVVDLYSQAKDTEALTEIYEWQKGKLLDKAAEQLLPQNMIVMIAAVRAYKASLEVVRDKVFIPSMEASIYDRYKSARGGQLDHRYASPDEAYDQATASGSYFPAKQKMYDELIKSRNYNKELMGERFEAAVWKQVDNFWKNRLEAKYAQELTRRNRDSMLKQVWNNSRGDLEKLRKAAAQVNQPKAAEKTKAPKPKPEDDLKKIEGLFKGLLDDEKPKAAPKSPPAPAATSPDQGGSLNYRTKSQPSGGNIKSGQVVQSCSACAPAGLDCECGKTTCVCCSRGNWCWPK